MLFAVSLGGVFSANPSNPSSSPSYIDAGPLKKTTITKPSKVQNERKRQMMAQKWENWDRVYSRLSLYNLLKRGVPLDMKGALKNKEIKLYLLGKSGILSVTDDPQPQPEVTDMFAKLVQDSQGDNGSEKEKDIREEFNEAAFGVDDIPRTRTTAYSPYSPESMGDIFEVIDRTSPI